ncbi:MAG: hypothetical protein Q7R86_02275 [bacterium]|nr:hypothetical protein [bacterium]
MTRAVKRILKFEVPKSHYTADALIFWCFDDRFSHLLKAFIDARGFKHVDVVKVAGGAKGLFEYGTEQNYLLDQMDKSLKLHYPPEIILMVHDECGAYDKTFGKSEEMIAFLSSQLDAMADSVRKHLAKLNQPDVKITECIADFEGILEI